MATRLVDKYLSRHGITRPILSGTGPELAASECAVIIPSYAESVLLPQALASLAVNPVDQLSRTVVLVVVNTPPAGSDRAADQVERARLIADNRATLAWLRGKPFPELRVGWLDATSPGCELPGSGGVGLARKTGADSVLAAWREASPHQVSRRAILHLDADTTVEPNYLATVAGALLTEGYDACTPAFAHQAAGDAGAQEAIDSYELFLRYYVEGLRLAGSPYAFHTLGSAMASTADAYVRAAGIPAKRQAGEDFYFLQQLAKNGSVVALGQTIVHPSARQSGRAPFGTGQRVRELLAGDAVATGYDPRTFGILRALFQAVAARPFDSAAAILTSVQEPEAREFLERQRFALTWGKLQDQHRSQVAMVRAFHVWFDALATVRLVRHLARTSLPPPGLLEAWQGLIAGAAVTAPPITTPARFLDWARQRQGEHAVFGAGCRVSALDLLSSQG